MAMWYEATFEWDLRLFALPLLCAVLQFSGFATKTAQSQEKKRLPELQTAREHLQKGRYEEAADAYRKLVGNVQKPGSAIIGLSRALESQGNIVEATRLLKTSCNDRAKNADLVARYAELLFAQGQFDEAQKQVDRSLKINTDQMTARLIQAHLWRETGRIKEAGSGYVWFVRYYNRKQPTDAESLLLVAEGAVRYARWKGASQIFNFIVNTLCPDALRDDPLYWQAYAMSGSLLLEKFNRSQALPELREALTINPRATQVLYLMAEASAQKHKVEEADGFLNRALKVNPTHVPSLQLRAQLKIGEGDLTGAMEILDQANRNHPQHQRTSALQTACFLLNDGLGEIDRWEKLLADLDDPDAITFTELSRAESLIIKLAKRNPRPGFFLADLAEALESQRKYELAELLYRRTTEIMPELSGPKSALGLLYMRVGKTDQAQKLLDDAFKSDPFHVRVSNMRKVLRLLADYRVIQTEHFVIRVDSKLDRVLGEYMAEYLEGIHDELTEQYGFEPPHRTQFEIYNNAKGLSAHQWFSARMVGLPWIQTIGASTGVIVALASPTASDEPFNWAQVLKHEYVHVITLQQTKFNIPHWFTEALAVTAEGYPRSPEWNKLLLERVPRGDMRTLKNLSDGFRRPESPADWQFAYCQSRLYAQYMVETFGQETIAKMLEAYSRNLTTEKAIREVFGMDIAVFEKGYLEFVQKIVAEMQPSVADGSNRSIAMLEKEYRTNSDDPKKTGAYAVAVLKSRNFTRARELAEAAIAKEPKEPNAGLVLAILALRAGDTKGTAEYLTHALDREQPHPRVLNMLADLRLEAGAIEEAIELFSLGRQNFPHDVEWLKSLAKAHLQSESQTGLRSILIELSRFESDNVAVRKKLAQMSLDEGDAAAAEKFAMQALHIDVLDAEIHRILGEALNEQKNWDKAIREFEVALELKPADATLEIGLAKSLLGHRQSAAARDVLQKLLQREPAHAEAEKLLKSIP